MGMTIAIVAGSLLVSAFVLVMVLRAAGTLGPRKKVLATGLPGQAMIVGVTPTGTVINDINYVCRFQLRVELPGQAPYDVETKETVPITGMGQIVPGTVVGVRVAQNDRTKVFVDWQQGVVPPGTPAAAVSTADLAGALRDTGTAQRVPTGSAAELLRTGQPAQGYLVSFADTGQTPRSLGRQADPAVLDDPLYVLEVELHLAPGMTPIVGKVVHRVPRAVGPMLRVGMPLSCAVDPGNPTRNFAIDFAAVASSYAPSSYAPSPYGAATYGAAPGVPPTSATAAPAPYSGSQQYGAAYSDAPYSGAPYYGTV